MTSRYRYQFPIGIHIYKWGVNIWLQHPIVKKADPDSISIFLNFYDDLEN